MAILKTYKHGYSMTDWIKYGCRNPDPRIDYNKFVNKHLVKSVVGDTIKTAKEFYYLRDVKDLDNVDFTTLPSKFMIKSAHGSGHNKVIDQAQGIDLAALRSLVLGWLHPYGCEVQLCQRQVECGIVIEEFLGGNITDYKFGLVHGEIAFIGLLERRLNEAIINSGGPIGRTDLSPQLHLNNASPLAVQIQKKFEKVVNELYKLLPEIPYIRLDLYTKEGVLYFGEYTFFPTGGLSWGMTGFSSEKTDKWLGSLIDIQLKPWEIHRAKWAWEHKTSDAFKDYIKRYRQKEKMLNVNRIL